MHWPSSQTMPLAGLPNTLAAFCCSSMFGKGGYSAIPNHSRVTAVELREGVVLLWEEEELRFNLHSNPSYERSGCSNMCSCQTEPYFRSTRACSGCSKVWRGW